MTAYNYGFQTPRDLLEKLGRDAALLRREVTPDSLFNFVVTAWSLADWVTNTNAALRGDVDATLRSDLYLRVCRDLATHSKHYTVTPKSFSPPVVSGVDQVSGAFDPAAFQPSAFATGGFLVQVGGDKYLMEVVIDRVLKLYEDFFTAHGL